MTRARDVATQGGLVLLNTTTFSAQSTVSINNVFSSTYDNYKVLVNLNSVSTTLNGQLRLRVSGTDDTSGFHYSSGISTIPTTTTISNWNYQGTTSFIPFRAVGLGVSEINLFNPAKPITTIVTYNSLTNFGDTQFNTGGGQHLVNTAYDGFSLIASTGNMTGTIEVYGYK
jgi:hypothetical protein